jgi:WG containing repeat
MKDGDDLWGYINTSGEFAIPPRFESSLNDYVWPFSDGLARIEVNHRFGFINHSGEFVIKARLPDATDFSDGMARVVMEGPCTYFPDGPVVR